MSLVDKILIKLAMDTLDHILDDINNEPVKKKKKVELYTPERSPGIKIDKTKIENAKFKEI